MEFNYAYQKDSLVSNDAKHTSMSFAPDTLREPTYFRGELKQKLGFREGISALHDVVISDLRWQPKDRTEYKRWLAQQEELDWEEVAAQRGESAEKLHQIRGEIDELQKRSFHRMKPFYVARQKYFDYIYSRDYKWWYILDPVITVHPDEVFFECFSQDESSYGRLGVDYNVFQNVGEFACGTTNIDYSAGLYDEFQKIRSYKQTRFEIDPSGFDVKTGQDDSFKEVKIDLPDSWVRGFLQVSSAMAFQATTLTLHPMDIHNICFILRRNRELVGPRSMRFRLKPGDPIKIVFDPWGTELVCHRSIYHGARSDEIRVWGRRRIHILERLIPVAKSFSVQLLGNGMPSFYTADLGDMTFTLGLSGWTANDWSSAGNFDLLAPRAEVDMLTKRQVFGALKENWLESPQSLATRLGVDRSVVLGALAAYTQAGSAIWDANKGVYRVRELSREPLPLERLRFANEREAEATRLIEAGLVRVSTDFTERDGNRSMAGTVQESRKKYDAALQLDADERMVDGSCTCNFFRQNRMRKGPCAHMLAIRMQHSRETTQDKYLIIN